MIWSVCSSSSISVPETRAILRFVDPPRPRMKAASSLSTSRVCVTRAGGSPPGDRGGDFSGDLDLDGDLDRAAGDGLRSRRPRRSSSLISSSDMVVVVGGVAVACGDAELADVAAASWRFAASEALAGGRSNATRADATAR